MTEWAQLAAVVLIGLVAFGAGWLMGYDAGVKWTGELYERNRQGDR